jgi:glycerophosphoryl diester phosphodiesterase
VSAALGRLFARRTRAWLRPRERPWVLGHRGARRRAPENTLAAFELAMREGADGVELDVRLDRDGDVVVIHDPSLGRVTSGRDDRRVDALSREDLEQIDLGGGERVPRLADVLAWSRERGARVNVELKSDLRPRARLAWEVFKLVLREKNARERFILSSFDPLLVALSARLMPWIPVGYLLEDGPLPGAVSTCVVLGACALHPKAALVTGAAIAPFRVARLPVNVWTVNDVDEARRLAALGVDCLISDVPGQILDGLGSI